MKPGGRWSRPGRNARLQDGREVTTGGRTSREHRGKVAAGNWRRCRAGETAGPRTRVSRARPEVRCLRSTPSSRGQTGSPRPPGSVHLPLAFLRLLTKPGRPDAHQRGRPFCQPQGLAAGTRAVGVGRLGSRRHKTRLPPGTPAPAQRRAKPAPPPGQPCPRSEVTRGSVGPG